MWEKVLDAGIEDALGVVRLGDSLELGGFLGYDLLKGKDRTEIAFGSTRLILSHSRTGKKW